MKLDRNIAGNEGRGKYALVLLRQALGNPTPEVNAALAILERHGVLDWGEAGTASEFFVIRLKDRNAARALYAYADECYRTDPQFYKEVRELADRAGHNSPWCKDPD